jgi:hypothetical protein
MTNDNTAPRRLRAESVPPERYEAFGAQMMQTLIHLTREQPGWVQMLLDTACTTTDPKEERAASFLALLLVDLNKEVIEAHMAAQYAGGQRPTQEDHLS